MFTLSSRGSKACDIGCVWSERKAAAMVPRARAPKAKLRVFLGPGFAVYKQGKQAHLRTVAGGMITCLDPANTLVTEGWLRRQAAQRHIANQPVSPWVARTLLIRPPIPAGASSCVRRKGWRHDMTTETQTQPVAQDSGEKKNRKLKIKCAPTLQWNTTSPPWDIGATMTFEEDSDGTEPGMSGVISPGDNGEIVIDISNMPKNDNYNENLDITLKLETKNMLGPDGKKLDGGARWANDTEGHETYNGKDYTLGYLWFCTANPESPTGYDRMPPVTIDNVTKSKDDKDDKIIEILDDTPDGAPAFGFCVGFVLEGYGDYYISIDPVISTKNTRNASFMLKE
jgi:hypothetical protein